MPFIKGIKQSRTKLLESKTLKSGLRTTICSLNGDKYTGGWLDDKKHGIGTQVWKRTGAIYSGEWKFGKRDGFGTYSVPVSGSNSYVKKYYGQWDNGKKHGEGIYYYSNGAFYEGEWYEDQRSGKGILYDDNFIYEGKWLNDKYHGEGTMLLANGNCYNGPWRTGEKHGYGKFFFADTGRLYDGVWVNGIAKCGTISKNPNYEPPSPMKYKIPKIELEDVETVLDEAIAALTAGKDEDEDAASSSPPNADLALDDMRLLLP